MKHITQFRTNKIQNHCLKMQTWIFYKNLQFLLNLSQAKNRKNRKISYVR